VITPRATRLVRVPDVRAMRAAIARLAPAADISARRIAVVVPTRSAAAELRRSLETAALAGGGDVVVLPDFVTRTDLYQRLHGALRDAPALLTEQEREVLLRRAAREAAASGVTPPFRLRPGLVVQMLDFYDELRRRERTLDDFERLVLGQLAPSADIDRGAERLVRQTEFLCAAFARVETLIAGTGRVDEHGLRALLLDPAADLRPTFDHVIITVADRSADPRGLYAGDYDLLTRLPGLARIDVVSTENLLASGFHERIHQLLPGLEEERWTSETVLPVLVAPEGSDPARPWHVSRDREEELGDLVRWLKGRAASAHEHVQPPPLDRIGVIFQRPLPYLYLARQVLRDGHLPYQALDALPLSAEPAAAVIDVVLSVLASEASRASLVELLHSPHLVFSADVSRRDVLALDTELRDRQYAGGWDRLIALEPSRPDPGLVRALECVRSAASRLRDVLAAPSASAQFGALLAWIREFERLPDAHASRDGATWIPGHLRARAAILGSIDALREAHARHDDEPLDVNELGGSIRRWIDAQTFSPRTGTAGVRLLDAASAPYADLDEARIVGLVERDWPEKPPRSIFYPASILSLLGWPADAPMLTAARARFQDLLILPADRLSLSTFTLEDDAIVSASPLLEEIELAGLPAERWPVLPRALAFEHEFVERGLTASPDGVAADWLALRTMNVDRARIAGRTKARPPRPYGISYLERYLDCPFKYFASRVLELPEERDEESGLSPIERGHFIHGVFETFFGQWQATGHGTITLDNVAEALELFERVAERHLARLPDADQALERTHLLGSAAASGLAERAFAFEIEGGGQVVERLLEHVLEGPFDFVADGTSRTVQVKAKADRIDLMADGTLRIIDYKLGRAPKQSRALQLPIYGVMARQALEGHRGRSWTVSGAGYVAFKEKEAFVPLGGRAAALDTAIADGQSRMLAAIDAIERGEFPVKPEEPYRCQWCGYAAVCRKDYVGDE
jgi:RecB family exonuclease